MTREALVQALFSHSSGYVELRAKNAARTVVSEHVLIKDGMSNIDRFADLHRADDVWFGVAPRLRVKGGTLRDCGELSALWVDLDSHDGQAEAMASRLRAFPLPPSIVVESGHGLHAYWLLHEGLSVQADEGSAAKRLLRGLALATHGDLAAAEPARVLRLPGTFNQKHRPVRPVTIRELSDRKYSLEDLEDAIPIALLLTVWPPKGKRHGARLALAGFLLRCGVSEDRVREMLVRVTERTHGDTDDAAAVVESTAARLTAGEKVAGGPTLQGLLVGDGAEVLRQLRTFMKLGVPDYPLTEAGDAEFFAEQYTGEIAFDHGRQEWFQFREHHWQPDTQQSIDQYAVNTMRERQRRALGVEDPDKRRSCGRWAHAGESRPRINHMLSFARSEPGIAVSGDAWDQDSMQLGVANGVVDLRTGQLRDGQPHDRITLVSPVTYDPAAGCPRWEQFMQEVSNERADWVEFMQRSVGYSLTGEVGEQCFWMLYGTGAKGLSDNN
jgi:hypothetical protein